MTRELARMFGGEFAHRSNQGDDLFLSTREGQGSSLTSDGYSEWQADTIRFVKSTCPGDTDVGAGNVVGREGFLYLVEAGAQLA
jgi:hypothetical protein